MAVLTSSGVLSSPARQGIESEHSRAFWCLIIFTGVVALGLVLEVLAHREEFRQIWRELTWLRTLRRSGRQKLISSLATLVVAIGVIGEFWFEYKAGKTETDLQAFDNKAIAVLEKTVESDRQSLSERLEKATTDAKETKEELDASISKARGEVSEIEKEVRQHGPRDIPIRASESIFDKELKRFAGQHFRDSVCRPDLPLALSPVDTDTLPVEAAIADALAHAGWINVKPRSPNDPWPLIAENCSAFSVLVNTSPNASPETKTAANALASVFRMVLSERKTIWVGDGKMGDPPLPPLPSDVVGVHVGKHMLHQVE